MGHHPLRRQPVRYEPKDHHHSLEGSQQQGPYAALLRAGAHRVPRRASSSLNLLLSMASSRS